MQIIDDMKVNQSHLPSSLYFFDLSICNSKSYFGNEVVKRENNADIHTLLCITISYEWTKQEFKVTK